MAVNYQGLSSACSFVISTGACLKKDASAPSRRRRQASKHSRPSNLSHFPFSHRVASHRLLRISHDKLLLHPLRTIANPTSMESITRRSRLPDIMLKVLVGP